MVTKFEFLGELFHVFTWMIVDMIYMWIWFMIVDIIYIWSILFITVVRHILWPEKHPKQKSVNIFCTSNESLFKAVII